MFQPDQAALVAWTSEWGISTAQPSADINQPRRSPSPRGAEERQCLRRMALTVGFTILLLVLALVALSTSSAASVQAVVAPPPVFCEPSTQARTTTEPDTALIPVSNRSWVMCVQPHTRASYLWPVRCWIRLWNRCGPLDLKRL